MNRAPSFKALTSHDICRLPPTRGGPILIARIQATAMGSGQAYGEHGKAPVSAHGCKTTPAVSHCNHWIRPLPKQRRDFGSGKVGAFGSAFSPMGSSTYAKHYRPTAKITLPHVCVRTRARTMLQHAFCGSVVVSFPKFLKEKKKKGVFAPTLPLLCPYQGPQAGRGLAPVLSNPLKSLKRGGFDHA
jgi:hypothetical protein